MLFWYYSHWSVVSQIPQLLGVNRCTTNAMIYGDTGTMPVSKLILSRATNYFMNICNGNVLNCRISCINVCVVNRKIILYISLIGWIKLSKIYLESEWEIYGFPRVSVLQMIMWNMLLNLDKRICTFRNGVPKWIRKKLWNVYGDQNLFGLRKLPYATKLLSEELSQQISLS